MNFIARSLYSQYSNQAKYPLFNRTGSSRPITPAYCNFINTSLKLDPKRETSQTRLFNRQIRLLSGNINLANISSNAQSLCVQQGTSSNLSINSPPKYAYLVNVKATCENNMKVNREKDALAQLEIVCETLKRNFEIIYPVNGIEEKLKHSYQTKTPLRIKLGFDPTAPDLHLGHVVVLKKLREFQQLGHKVIIIIGDFTAAIGDPTGRNKTRPPLSLEEIKKNAETYLNQLSKIIDVSEAEIHFNSEWFDKLNFRNILDLLSKLTISQILTREDFSNRYDNNIPIFFHELIYPIIQGYDSFVINADIEIGGTDQLFNCTIGRHIQANYQKVEQAVACVSILKGTDGSQKMSKSLNNYIALMEEPHNMYGKLMSIPDSLIEEYVRLVSTFSPEKLLDIKQQLSEGTTNPMLIKKELAYDVVKQFHGDEIAKVSEEHFYKQIQSRNQNLIAFQEISLSQLNLKFSDLTLISLCYAIDKDKSSKGAMRRLIEGGGVTINTEKITDPDLVISSLTQESFNLRVGKRAYYEVKLI